MAKEYKVSQSSMLRLEDVSIQAVQMPAVFCRDQIKLKRDKGLLSTYMEVVSSDVKLFDVGRTFNHQYGPAFKRS